MANASVSSREETEMKRSKVINGIMAVVLCLAMLSGVFVFSSGTADAASWNVNFKTIAKGKVLGQNGYRSLQGLGFDTYTCKDGYSFVESNNGKDVQLIHFTMSSKGKCKKVKKVKYKRSNVGHANDATVYRDASGAKWLFFSLYGSAGDKTAITASDGSPLKLGVIKLSDYNKGSNRVYNCYFNGVFGDKMIRDSITGITYIGMRTIPDDTAGTAAGTKTVPMFVILSGQRMVQAYLTFENGFPMFNAYGIRARFKKAKFKNGAAVSYQGIAYHKGYLYICGEGRAKSVLNTMLIGRIKMSSLFNGDDKYEKSLTICEKKIKKDGKKKLSKNAPEAVFFTNLDGKSKLYLSVNRKIKKGNKDSDSILRSKSNF